MAASAYWAVDNGVQLPSTGVERTLGKLEAFAAVTPLLLQAIPAALALLALLFVFHWVAPGAFTVVFLCIGVVALVAFFRLLKRTHEIPPSEDNSSGPGRA